VFDGFPAFREQRLVGLEHMKHARPDFERHVDPGSAGIGGQLDTIVTNDFMLTDLNEQRRDAGVVPEYW